MLDDKELGRLRNLMQDPKAPARPAPSPAPPSKGKVGKYNLLRLLGPNTWECTDGQKPNALVLKILGLTKDETKVKLLCGDLKSIVSVRHPVLVTYHKLSQIEGNYFVVRDYIDGKPMSATELEPVAALQAFYEVTRAVEFAHAVGVAHGGIAASNVIMDPSGRPFLVDLGAARLRARFRPSDATPVPTLSSPLSDVRALVHLFRTVMEEGEALRSATSGAKQGGLLRPIDPSIDPLLAEAAAMMPTFEAAREMAEAVGRVLTAMPQHSTSVGLMEKFRRNKEETGRRRTEGT